MKHLLHRHHPLRIFLISGLVTIASLAAVGYYMGPAAFFIASVLILVEITFSFENAIINAKVLSTVSEFWRTIFITVGILIAVIGMRIVFPILIVMITAGLPPGEVLNLALNNPDAYAKELHEAHISIAAFGGMFLLMLCLHFFFDKNRRVRWIDIIEKPLQDMSRWWLYSVICIVLLLAISLLPANPEPRETFLAGAIGIALYIAVHGLAELFARRQRMAAKGVLKTGLAGFMAFLYLEILDASFSFDGVIGAFAVTKDVILIAIGLGIGAIWVRSLTIFMVRRHILHAYRYLEHGAHYTIGVLALVLIAGIFFNIPELIAGLAGIILVSASIVSSVAASRQAAKKVVRG
ncbi:MAG TPA: DUF475 domain-containing protein [Candidatus Saccharibacteria bacterium]|nr:DUF475 domain-containing protein [Candidatus Saccharibacteria bacterium]